MKVMGSVDLSAYLSHIDYNPASAHSVAETAGVEHCQMRRMLVLKGL